MVKENDMPNYIDKGKLIRDLIDNRNFYPAIVKRAIENAPTEDVVPRSEIEELQKFKDMAYAEVRSYNEELKARLDQAKQTRYMITENGSIEMIPTVESVRQEVAREILDEFECHISTGIRILKDCINDTDTDQVKRHLLGRLHELCGMEKFIAELKNKYIGE
jgi:hypothetical protein